MALNRRDLLKLLPAGSMARMIASGGLSGSAIAALTGVAAQAEEAGYHSFAFGEFEVAVLSDGGISLPVDLLTANMDADAARALLAENGLPTDIRPGAINIVMLTRGEERILIDVGGGPNFVPTAGFLTDSLDAGGIDPESVNKVVITHAHPDHVWGLIDEFLEEPRFPNAAYTMAQAEFDYWMADGRIESLPDRMKPFALGAQRNLGQIAEMTAFVSGEHAVAPGVTAVPSPGHTPGHMSVIVESGGEQLLITGDTITHHVIAFEKPDWHFGLDMDFEQAAETRKAQLAQAAADNMLLIGYHLPWPGVGRVETAGSAYRYVAGG